MLKYFSVSVILVSIILYYYQEQIYIYFDALTPHSPQFSNNNERLFTNLELMTFNGVDTKLLYLSILGRVYDVTAGEKHYGPNSNYHVFVGRDASKSFITGEFSDTNKELDDVLDLSHSELLDLENWIGVYEKQYIYKGILIGRFYDSNGKPTEYYNKVFLKLQDAKKIRSDIENNNLKYPPCNSEWDPNAGSRVWCTKKSGGIERDWEGVPRMLYTAGSTDPKCVCIKSKEEADKQSSLKEYKGCNSTSVSCSIAVTELN